MRRRAFTLIEATVGLTLIAFVLGAVTMLHIAIVKGLGVQSARFATSRQVQTLIDVIDDAGQYATSYNIVSVNGTNCLKLTLPASCSDTDNDGVPDSCKPQRLTKYGLEEWGTGNRLWVWKGDASGKPLPTGTYIYVGTCPNDSVPSSTWKSVGTPGSLVKFPTYKWNTIDTLSFAAITGTRFSVSVASSQNTGGMTGQKISGSFDANQTEATSITRTIFIMGWVK